MKKERLYSAPLLQPKSGAGGSEMTCWLFFLESEFPVLPNPIRPVGFALGTDILKVLIPLSVRG